jgi:hypothetical protein
MDLSCLSILSEGEELTIIYNLTEEPFSLALKMNFACQSVQSFVRFEVFSAGYEEYRRLGCYAVWVL